MRRAMMREMRMMLIAPLYFERAVCRAKMMLPQRQDDTCQSAHAPDALMPMMMRTLLICSCAMRGALMSCRYAMMPRFAECRRAPHDAACRIILPRASHVPLRLMPPAPPLFICRAMMMPRARTMPSCREARYARACKCRLFIAVATAARRVTTATRSMGRADEYAGAAMRCLSAEARLTPRCFIAPRAHELYASVTRLWHGCQRLYFIL